MLFRQDDRAKYFYIVRAGEVVVEVPSLYGPPLEVQRLGYGHVSLPPAGPTVFPGPSRGAPGNG